MQELFRVAIGDVGTKQINILRLASSNRAARPVSPL